MLGALALEVCMAAVAYAARERIVGAFTDDPEVAAAHDDSMIISSLTTIISALMTIISSLTTIISALKTVISTLTALAVSLIGTLTT